MSILHEICARKRDHIEHRKNKFPVAVMEIYTKNDHSKCGFLDNIKNAGDVAIIAEIKKASPSGGVIREDFDPVAIAKTYQKSGAACLSVLTDEPYFQGQDEYLRKVKKASTLPVLRKDFILDPYQVYESRALGTDCVLLIMAALSDEDADKLHGLSKALGMDVLVEIHNEEELERALALSPSIIGVNNRNLKTLEVDINTSLELVDKIPDNIVKVTESGIGSRDTILTLKDAGYKGFLIGESLMKSPDIGQALDSLLGK